MLLNTNKWKFLSYKPNFSINESFAEVSLYIRFKESDTHGSLKPYVSLSSILCIFFLEAKCVIFYIAVR